MRRIVSLFITFILCTWALQAQRIVFTPQWTPQSQFAGYYVAQEMGFYQEAGVEVDFQHPSASYSAVNRLLEGSSDIITQQLVQAMIAIDRGMPMVHVLQTSQHNALVLVSKSDSLRTLEDLKGKKVGVWKSGFGELAYIMDTEKNLDIQWIPFLESVNLFLSGAIDATLAMGYNEYLKIRASGHEDKPVIRFSETEYDYPEDGLYVSTDFYQRHPDKVKAFVEASRKGWEWAHEHPEETLDIVMKWAEKESVHTNRIHQQWMLEQIFSLQCEDGEKKPSFQLDRTMIDRLNELLLKHHYIHQPVDMEKLKGGRP
ncbi:MAG: ABC transporter substrate-binding protein [Bacteroides sp.]|nr:ABC transporter substrate-binding protein [Bacteroides sp.]